MKAVDLVLHPVRLRIAQAFIGDRQLTTRQLAEQLPEIPSATLYRQVAELLEGGVLEVVEERRVRGAVERTYRLRQAAASLNADDVAEMTTDEHRQAFTTFVATLLADYDRYLDAGDVDLARDFVGYRQAALNLSDREVAAFVAELAGVIATYAAKPPRRGRRRRVLTTILMPTDPPPPSSGPVHT